MKRSLFTITIGLALFCGLPVERAAAESAKAREKSAKKACAMGDFRKGVEVLAELYVDTDDATYVYNQGRCYEQNHQWSSAVDRFREFLRKASKLSNSIRKDAETHLADCQAFADKEEAARPAPPPMPVTPPAPVAVVQPASAPTPPGLSPAGGQSQVDSTSTPGRSGRYGLRVTGIILGSMGIAAVAGGLMMNLKANSLASDYNKNPADSTRSSQSSYKTGSAVLYGVGAGAFVAGVVFYLVGHSTNSTTSQVAIAPSVSPSELALTLRSAF
jgi:hypothetical protein